MYSLSKLCNPETDFENLRPSSFSKTPFRCWFVESFHILSDQRSIIGLVPTENRYYYSRKQVMMENTRTKKTQFYNVENPYDVECFIINEQRDLLVCGYDTKRVVLFNLTNAGILFVLNQILESELNSLMMHGLLIYFQAKDKVLSLDIITKEVKLVNSLKHIGNAVCDMKMIGSGSQKSVACVFNDSGCVVIFELNQS